LPAAPITTGTAEGETLGKALNEALLGTIVVEGAGEEVWVAGDGVISIILTVPGVAGMDCDSDGACCCAVTTGFWRNPILGHNYIEGENGDSSVASGSFSIKV